MSLNFTDLLEAAEAEALCEKLSPTELYVWESICRSYSVKFHTPLHVVVNQLDPLFVIKQHYASGLDDVDIDETIEQFLDSLYSLQDPNYERGKRDALDSDMAMYEQKEKERVEKGLPIHRAMKKAVANTPSLDNKLVPETEPTLSGPSTGFVNFAHLKTEEEQ